MAVCKVGRLITELPQPDARTLHTWLTEGTCDRGRPVSADVMASSLAAEGHKASPTTLKDHRGQRCTCYR